MFLQDLRFALRTLRKSPGYTSVAMISLALGIGANSTIFSLADGLLLRPLPVAEPGEVVTMRGVTPSDMFAGVSYRDFVDLNQSTKSFEGLAAYKLVTLGYAETSDALPQVKFGMAVSGNFFQAMRVSPRLGRVFRPEEDQAPGRDAVVILSHDLWEKAFSSDTTVLGRKLRLNGKDFTVIGVAPESFTGMDQYFRPALFIPAHMLPAVQANSKDLEDRGARGFSVKGRMKPGISLKQAEAELKGIAAALERDNPKTNRKYSVVLRTELQQRIEQSPPDSALVGILMGMVSLVLLIACANVTNLMLSRARARSREVAVRLAMGASRARLVAQLLTESLVVGVGGGVLGLLLAFWAVGIFSEIHIPTDLPIVLAFDVNRRVLLFTLAAAIASALLSGLAPAFQTSKSDLTTALKAGDQSASERKRFLGRNALVVLQVAVSMVLLISASMMVRAVSYLIRMDPGFRIDHLLTMNFDPELLRYSQEQSNAYYKRVLEVTRALPGVKSAALSSVLPLGNAQDGFEVTPEGYKFASGQEATQVFGSRVDESYFETMGTKLKLGRPFSATDTATSPKVAIVNQEFVNRYWKGQDGIGKRIRINNGKDWAQVVGVSETAPVLWIAEPPTPFVFIPFRQRPQLSMRLLVHTATNSDSITIPLREALRTIDPNQPVFDVRTIENFYHMRAISVSRLIAKLFSGAGLMGLVLSLVGLYGLISFSVSRRTREIGVRIAIGADRSQVMWMVLRQGLRLSLLGLAIGSIGGVAAALVMKEAFQIPAFDPVTFSVVPLGLLTVTVLATLIPARRAARIEPVRALRWE